MLKTFPLLSAFLKLKCQLPVPKNQCHMLNMKTKISKLMLLKLPLKSLLKIRRTHILRLKNILRHLPSSKISLFHNQWLQFKLLTKKSMIPLPINYQLISLKRKLKLNLKFQLVNKNQKLKKKLNQRFQLVNKNQKQYCMKRQLLPLLNLLLILLLHLPYPLLMNTKQLNPSKKKRRKKKKKEPAENLSIIPVSPLSLRILMQLHQHLKKIVNWRLRHLHLQLLLKQKLQNMFLQTKNLRLKQKYRPQPHQLMKKLKIILPCLLYHQRKISCLKYQKIILPQLKKKTKKLSRKAKSKHQHLLIWKKIPKLMNLLMLAKLILWRHYLKLLVNILWPLQLKKSKKLMKCPLQSQLRMLKKMKSNHQVPNHLKTHPQYQAKFMILKMKKKTLHALPQFLQSMTPKIMVLLQTIQLFLHWPKMKTLPPLHQSLKKEKNHPMFLKLHPLLQLLLY